MHEDAVSNTTGPNTQGNLALIWGTLSLPAAAKHVDTGTESHSLGSSSSHGHSSHRLEVKCTKKIQGLERKS